MEWTFPISGLDLSYVWDPELWIKFKEAVVWNEPELFWNKLWDRISYRELFVTMLVTSSGRLVVRPANSSGSVSTGLPAWGECPIGLSVSGYTTGAGKIVRMNTAGIMTSCTM